MIEVKMNDPAGVILTTAGQKCNQNIKVVPGFDIPEEYDGAYELLVPTVSGVWVWNEFLTAANDVLLQEVLFTSQNKEWKSIYFEPVILELVYTDSDNTNVSVWGVLWNDEAYRTIDFGTEPQEVSEEFYAWLTANAVKQ